MTAAFFPRIQIVGNCPHAIINPLPFSFQYDVANVYKSAKPPITLNAATLHAARPNIKAWPSPPWGSVTSMLPIQKVKKHNDNDINSNRNNCSFTKGWQTAVRNMRLATTKRTAKICCVPSIMAPIQR